MTERELRAVAEAIKEQLPSFSVGINNPNDVSNAKYAQAISEASAQAAISASDSKYVKGLVEALEYYKNECDENLYTHNPLECPPSHKAKEALAAIEPYLTKEGE
jgi:hypothetical protein